MFMEFAQELHLTAVLACAHLWHREITQFLLNLSFFNSERTIWLLMSQVDCTHRTKVFVSYGLLYDELWYGQCGNHIEAQNKKSILT